MCCLSLCLTYYRREWNTLDPPDNKLSLFSSTRLCRWSLLFHALVHYGISATSLPHVSVVWHLNNVSPMRLCSTVVSFLKKHTHIYPIHNISNTKINYLKHITKHIFLFMNTINTYVDIKILWWIHNRLIVHDKIFAIKLISNWWRGQTANEIKPRGNIKWRKPYGSVRRKDLYGKFLLNEIPN